MFAEACDEDIQDASSKVPLHPPPPPPRSFRKPSKNRRLDGPSTRPLKYDQSPRLFEEHMNRLSRLLLRFVDDRNWKDAARTFSVLEKYLPRGTREWSLSKLRRIFVSAIQIEIQDNGDFVKPARIRELCDVWTRSLKLSKMCVKERHIVQLELALFYLIHGRSIEARQLTEFLLQENEITNDPKLHLVHGMTLFQIWYSGLPKEMTLNDSVVNSVMQFEGLFNHNFEQINVDKTMHHSSSRESQLQISSSSYSYNSVVNAKGHQMEIDHIETNFFEDNEPEEVAEKMDEFPDSKLGRASIFTCHGLSPWLLPIRLNIMPGNMDEIVNCHMGLLDENYVHAVSHLRDALFSEPPLFAALIPYVQVLLLGDQVDKVLHELKKISHLSNSALSFRLRADLLEVFCKNQLTEICECHENVLQKDPTCSFSLERLISISKDGNYGKMDLLDMIALHLDASPGNCNTWRELASCLLDIQTARTIENDGDRVSANDASIQHHASHGNLINFSKKKMDKSWELRYRWWRKRHFSYRMYLGEMKTGDWQLLTCKAASASHLYGPTFTYVKDVNKSLAERSDNVNISFLQKHMEKSLKLCEILFNRTL